jgi:hypothetical protein
VNEHKLTLERASQLPLVPSPLRLILLVAILYGDIDTVLEMSAHTVVDGWKRQPLCINVVYDVQRNRVLARGDVWTRSWVVWRALYLRRTCCQCSASRCLCPCPSPSLHYRASPHCIVLNVRQHETNQLLCCRTRITAVQLRSLTKLSIQIS